MKLPVEEARTLCEAVLQKAGLDSESAGIIADVLIEPKLLQEIKRLL